MRSKVLLKKCATCNVFIPYGERYCNRCKSIAAEREKENKAKLSAKYNRKRNPKYSNFYKSKEWKMLARKRLQTDKYKCRRCGQLAEEVDHIIPIQTDEGWEMRLDFSNTQSLCTKCHNLKHHRFLPKNGKG